MKKITKPLQIVLFLLVFLFISVLGSTALYPANSGLANLPAQELPLDLDQYLRASESAFSFKYDTEKKIYWAHADKQITPISLVYLHGFSATRQEIHPVVEKLGEKLGANVFFTRLHGHGVSGDDLGNARAEDWVADANEALAIGRRIGHRVILIGTSTGASLAIHLARNNPPDVMALILLAANFQPASILSWLAAGPGGALAARLLLGKNRTWTPANEKQAFFWTTTYPTQAIHEMMDLLKYVNSIDLKAIQIPTLMLYTDRDTVVSVDMIKQKYQEFASPQKKLVRMNSLDHIMAGDIMDREMNEPITQEILAFLKPEMTDAHP